MAGPVVAAVAPAAAVAPVDAAVPTPVVVGPVVREAGDGPRTGLVRAETASMAGTLAVEVP